MDGFNPCRDIKTVKNLRKVISDEHVVLIPYRDIKTEPP